MKKILYAANIILILCLSSAVHSQQIMSQKSLKNERSLNYTKYLSSINRFIPTGWNPGDLIETQMPNAQNQVSTYLILLIFKGASSVQNTPAAAKIIVIQKNNDIYAKSWESNDNINAVDGIIGDMETHRYPVDINGDGKKEIFITFSTAPIPSQGLMHLWIYRWNGTQGILISPKGDNGLSIFTGTQSQPTAIIDSDNDGIFEIFANDDKIYKWNQSTHTYDYWKDEQVPN